MITILIMIPLSVIIFLIIVNVISVGVYGGYISNETVNQIIDEYGSIRINQFESSILMFENDNFDGRGESVTFIAKTSFNVFSSYYVNNYGQVYRWSEGHKQIKKIYEDLNKNK